MDVIGIDKFIVERIVRILKHRRDGLPRLNLFDEKLYPSIREEPEITANYFVVMVAMDHRLSRPGKLYYACIEDGCYKGADLLYRLGVRKLREDPSFFLPWNLSKVTSEEVRSVFSVGETQPPDVETRTMLLRDLGLKLIKFYNSSVLELIKKSNNRIRGSIIEPGLVDNLRIFKAYEDPVEKKSMLLAKFLISRGLFTPVDDLDVAVDNHLSRVAYRLGLVMVSGTLWDKIRHGVEVTYEEDILLRLFVRRAYKLIAHRSGINAGEIDDYFWIMGRNICLRDDPPLCEKCLFKDFCRAKKNNTFMVSEHNYYNTWYY